MDRAREMGPRASEMSRAPSRHWRRYGTGPLPTGAEVAVALGMSCMRPLNCGSPEDPKPRDVADYFCQTGAAKRSNGLQSVIMPG
jgi:hypothetical protein